MKRHGDLWDKITDLENIRQAHYAARKGKSHYTEVKWVNENEEAAIKAIQRSLVQRTFTTSAYEVEDRFDGRKMRTIHKLPYYPDRIVQHALIQVCEPIWKASFIRDTFQSITGRGTHDARKRVKLAVRQNPRAYVLKFDIRKYYPSIDNDVMKEKVRRKIKCPKTLWLLDDIIDSCKGLPIGNYTSQYLGNLYLNDFDWYVKQAIKPLSYFRYCDDLVIFARDAQQAHDIRREVFAILDKHYRLGVKKDWQVFPLASRGLDFVGFVFRPNILRLRKNIAKGVREKARAIRKNGLSISPYKVVNGAGSYWGWCKHGGAKALWAKIMTAPVLATISQCKLRIRELQQCA